MLIYSSFALASGFILDMLLGDPHGWPHIVRGFGFLISAFERLYYPLKNKRLGGLLLVISVLIFGAGLPAVLLMLACNISSYLYFALETLLCWQLLAVKSLRVESKAVYERLAAGDLIGARKAVSMIVGRDTAELDEVGVTKAAVETVAENTSDGIAAPLFYMLFGGAALGCLYKAVNTMDSMVGYKNERYMNFGTAAAKFDDILNFIPSRLCAVTMIAASFLCGFDAKNALRIWKRDRLCHASPNSAQTEAVMAGALRVRLAGDAYYFGKLHKKPFIGDDIRPVEPLDILRSHRLMNTAAYMLMLAALLIRWCVYAAL